MRTAVPSWLAGLPPGIALRREEAGDRAFAGRLYAANREAAGDGAFDVQSRQLFAAWPRADRFTVIEGAGRVPIGRLYVSRRARAWHLIEIGLMPQWQRRGIGAALVGALQRAAAGAGAQRLDLEVARDNAAAATLYARLGFVDVATASATHRMMAWDSGKAGRA